YGIKYDYGSIMHYNAYMGAVNIAKPTIIPKAVDEAVNMPKLGQREKLSEADVEILNKMYCMPGAGTCSFEMNKLNSLADREQTTIPKQISTRMFATRKAVRVSHARK
ncbi:astacin, partial [Teladorsagia circumcincta]